MYYSTTTAFVCKLQQTDMADIIRRLGRDATILTGNQRLARVLRHRYDQSMIEAGREVWPGADILPWSAWLQRLWQEAMVVNNIASDLFLLDAFQERQVWQQILRTMGQSLPWQTDELTVTHIMAAAQDLRAWKFSWDAATFAHNEDSRFFWKVLMAFERSCEKNGWVTAARLPNLLLPALQAGEVALPGELALIGFDELTPQQVELLQGLAKMGRVPEWLQFLPESAHVGKLACIDSRDELQSAAQWIRQRLEENADAQIGLVVPELSAQRALACRMLDDVLCPTALQPGDHELTRPYNLSLGLPLIQYPPIHAAFELLALHLSVAVITHVGRLLRSPFLAGWEEESSARALLDAHLRETGEWNVLLQLVMDDGSRAEQPYHCPVFVQCLKQLLELTRVRPEIAKPGEWGRQFSRWLTAVGWPGDRSLTSTEFQVIQTWQALLQQFVSLDWVAQPMTLPSALSRLKEMAASTVFQPESPVASIQVLGLLETNGLQFDYLWVMGVHDGVLPAPPQPNPFIPLPLQRQMELPRSTAERELQVAKRILQRLMRSAPEIVVSYPQRHQDELLIPSPLIAAFPSLNKEVLPAVNYSTWQQIIYQHSQLEWLTKDPAPPLEDDSIPGGSRAFKLQAACPFLAFAELRLAARPLGSVQLGLSMPMRGNLLHRLMEKIWSSLESHECLITMSAEILEKLIATKVNETLEEMLPRYQQSLGRHLQMLEFSRLSSLVRAWLDFEKQRAPFQVTAREQSAELVLSGRQVRVRIDRIDTLEQGGKLLIDYKTGSCQVDGWFGERPDEPQLPLYSLLFQRELAGLAFAQIKNSDMALKGVSDDEGYAPGIHPFTEWSQTRTAADWQAVIINWQQTLEKLAADFIAGQAEVDPRQYPQTCTYCALRPLCRIDEHLE